MAFVRAERSQLWLRLAIMGPSGSGKTFTALRIAKGIADRIGGLPPAVIDTEGRSASKYANRFVFDTDNLDDPSIDRYLASMNECIGAGYKVLVIDSLSHAWKQLLDEVEKIAKARHSGNTWAAWSEGTPKQNKFIQAIVNFPGHIIVTMRSKTEWVLEENSKGKMAPVKKGMAAQQGKDIEYEFDLLIEMNQDHWAKVTKDRTGEFQDQDIEKPGEEFGAALHDWLSAGNSPPPFSAKAIEQQCRDAMTEIGTILKTVYEGQYLFTEDEINKARADCVSTKDRNPEDRLFFITKFLKEKKEQMIQRIEMIGKAALEQTWNDEPPPLEVPPAALSTPPVPSNVPPESPTETKAEKAEGWKDTIKRMKEQALAEEKAKTKAKVAPTSEALPTLFSESESGDDDFEDDIPDGFEEEEPSAAANWTSFKEADDELL
jgi:hypothetical protein